MVVLDQITEMKKQGIPTSQIMQSLKEQGISPKEINEAFSQSEIKTEINQTNPEYLQQQNVFPQTPETNINPQTAQLAPSGEFQPATINPSTTEMQPSMVGQQQQTNQSQLPPQNSPQVQQQVPSPEMQIQAPQVSQYPEYTPQENLVQGYTQEFYPEEYQEYQPPQSSDIETINDISTQIVEEKTKNFKNQLSAFTKFRNTAEEKLNSMDSRLAKIENSFEELQLSIIRKMGDYGEDIKNISKEMKATQDSFSKVINPLTESARDAQHDKESKSSKSVSKTKSNQTTKSRSRKSKKSDSFEDYLR